MGRLSAQAVHRALLRTRFVSRFSSEVSLHSSLRGPLDATKRQGATCFLNGEMTRFVVPGTCGSGGIRCAERISEKALRGSGQAGDVFTHLVLPVRPVVAAFGAPVVKRMANTFRGEHFGE